MLKGFLHVNHQTINSLPILRRYDIFSNLISYIFFYQYLMSVLFDFLVHEFIF